MFARLILSIGVLAASAAGVGVGEQGENAPPTSDARHGPPRQPVTEKSRDAAGDLVRPRGPGIAAEIELLRAQFGLPELRDEPAPPHARSFAAEDTKSAGDDIRGLTTACGEALLHLADVHREMGQRQTAAQERATGWYLLNACPSKYHR